MNGYTRILCLWIFVSLAICPSVALSKEVVKTEVVMKTGNKVHLFHSGTADVRRDICLNDVIPVYRETPTGGHTTVKEVGKVKVVSYMGEHYYVAEVVQGEIKVGDVAQKRGAYCLVQPAE